MKNQIDQYLEDGCGRCSLGGTPECKVHRWADELIRLRRIALDCGLIEEYKWSQPCYTYQGKNILLVTAFKEFAAMAFFKGSLLKDENKLLTAPGENSQANRQLRFTSPKDVQRQEQLIKAYVFEAIEIEKLGLSISFKKNPEPIPTELLDLFEQNGTLKKAFYELTAGRQRGYILYFSQPKQSKTRVARILKCIPLILRNEGLHDAYKSNK